MIPLDLYPYLAAGFVVILWSFMPSAFLTCAFVRLDTQRPEDIFSFVVGVWAIVVLAACVVLWKTQWVVVVWR